LLPERKEKKGKDIDTSRGKASTLLKEREELQSKEKKKQRKSYARGAKEKTI